MSHPSTIANGMHGWGAEHANRRDLGSLRLVGTVAADQPEGMARAPHGHRKGALPDRRYWRPTETEQIMISPLPALTDTKPGSATHPLPGVLADVLDDTTGESVEQGQGLLVLKRP
jgi:acetyl-CoA synthetase